MQAWDLMDWIVALGVLFAGVSAFYAWKTWRSSGQRRTVNKAEKSHRVKQSGGDGVTHNESANSSDVEQSG